MRNWCLTFVPSSYLMAFSLAVILFIISSPFSLGKMLRYAVQMLRSGLIFTRVTLTITPCIIRVCDWKIRLSSFCRSLEILFCLVSCIYCSVSVGCRVLLFAIMFCCRILSCKITIILQGAQFFRLNYFVFYNNVRLKHDNSM